MVISKLKKIFKKEKPTEEEEYIVVEAGKEKSGRAKILVRPWVIKRFEDVDPILNALREGYTIAVIDVRHIKAKDIVELKRVVAKLKKTADAIDGSIAGFGENLIIVTPSFAQIYKPERKQAE